ncbi:MAG: hypothetical protein IGR76_05155 [Synechococcales cyanobacterium T60_A2020_003]|nr:hypothetical protein [Synechococcales cyanobacterium T60_A2020_003]
MSMTLEGTIERVNLGVGAWVLKTPSQTYELYKAPPELLKAGLAVTVTGEIRADVMTTTMVGPVLEVKGFEVSG